MMAFFCQSELLTKLINRSDWLEKSLPLKKASFILDMYIAYM